MAHYAKVIDGIVTQVIVAEPEFFDTFVDSSPGRWIQTSYNTRAGVHRDSVTGLPSADQSKALRKNYAGIGDIYDEQLDAFYSKQPFPSWVLNTETCMWSAPVAAPTDAVMVKWNEATQSWIEV